MLGTFGRVRLDATDAAAGSRWVSAATLALTLLVTACGSDPGAGNDSTTHFWETCAADSECSSGNQCICGRCTQECDADESCAGVEAQCVAKLPALECEPPTKICAPESALQVNREQQVPDASLADQVGVGSETSAAVTDAGTATTLPQPMSSTASPASSAASSDTSAELPNTDSLISIDAATTSAEVVTSAADGSSAASSSALTDGETPALVPVLTPEQRYATRGTPWWMWLGAKPEQATDCELVFSTNPSEVDCKARWACAERNYDVACSKHTEDQWGCGCSYPGMIGTTGYFPSIVLTSDPATACEAGLAACTTIETERECVNQDPVYLDDDYYCEWERRCTYEAEPSGVAVKSSSPNGGRCIDDDGFSLCWCDGPNLNRTYVVQDATGDDVCEAAQAVCDVDLQPQAWQHAECIDEIQAYGESCQMARSCPLLGELSDRVTALAQLRASSQCMLNQEGELECRCTNDFGELNWIEPRPAGTQRCLDAVDMCEHFEAIEFDPEYTCGEARGEATLDNCWRAVPCTTTGTYRGVELQFTTYVTNGCNLSAQGGPWSCYCNAGRNESHAEFEETTNGSEVCAQYEAACISQLEFGLPVVDIP